MFKILIIAFFGLTFNCGQKKKTVIVQGTPGEKGETGEAGKKGEKGDQGVSGRDGLSVRGERGETGPQGNPGMNGQNGTQGQDGRPGDRGQDGTDGEVLIYPTPKYARYCYDFYDVVTLDECQGQISSRYHIFYRVYSMPNGDVFSDLCEGYGALANSCKDGLRTTATWTVGSPGYSEAGLTSKYLKARLVEPLKAEIKAKDFTHTVTCKATPPKG